MRVFVTGGANGIGRAIVKSFAANGDKIAFCDIDVTAAEQLSKECGAIFYKIDVKEQKELESCMDDLFTKWGDLDVIINNVGVGNFKNIIETKVEDFDNILAINLRPVFITSRYLAIHRSKLEIPNTFGRIINLCSTRYIQSEEGTEGYSASKGGIFSLTHSLAMSLSKYHITVNSIAPGWIQNTNYESLSKADHEQHPSLRVGKPEDIARMVMFLCNPENDFINGENITIDGGMTKKMIYVE